MTLYISSRRKAQAFTRTQWLFIVLLAVVAFELGTRFNEEKPPAKTVKPKPIAIKMPQQPLIESALQQDEEPRDTQTNLVSSNVTETVSSKPPTNATNKLSSKRSIASNTGDSLKMSSSIPPTTRRITVPRRTFPTTQTGPFTSPPPQEGIRVAVP